MTGGRTSTILLAAPPTAEIECPATHSTQFERASSRIQPARSIGKSGRFRRPTKEPSTLFVQVTWCEDVPYSIGPSGQGAAIVVSKVTVDIVLPILNEERTLEGNTRVLLKKLISDGTYDWSISIVDNGSTDGSWDIARRIARSELKVRAIRLERPGRGGALKAAWTSSMAEIVAYMDIDLSTELEALNALLDPIAAGKADISIGSRLVAGSEVTRNPLREVISHLYNFIARIALHYPVRDAQCGFKAASRNVVRTIVPAIEDDSWFFDTELLILAYRKGLRINEVPVHWVEDEDSRVRIVKTAIEDLRGIWRVRRGTDGNGSSAIGKENHIRVAVTISSGSAPSNDGFQSSSPETDAT